MLKRIVLVSIICIISTVGACWFCSDRFKLWCYIHLASVSTSHAQRQHWIALAGKLPPKIFPALYEYYEDNLLSRDAVTITAISLSYPYGNVSGEIHNIALMSSSDDARLVALAYALHKGEFWAVSNAQTSATIELIMKDTAKRVYWLRVLRSEGLCDKRISIQTVADDPPFMRQFLSNVNYTAYGTPP